MLRKKKDQWDLSCRTQLSNICEKYVTFGRYYEVVKWSGFFFSPVANFYSKCMLIRNKLKCTCINGHKIRMAQVGLASTPHHPSTMRSTYNQSDHCLLCGLDKHSTGIRRDRASTSFSGHVSSSVRKAPWRQRSQSPLTLQEWQPLFCERPWETAQILGKASP